ncbi:21184_t:CDS:2 [Rhizophagus irregularis]|nr:21184_t:CDS:2 [Rhizophagus irregularis]
MSGRFLVTSSNNGKSLITLTKDRLKITNYDHFEGHLTTIQPTSQGYTDNNNAYNAASNSVNGTISDNIQDTEFQNTY